MHFNHVWSRGRQFHTKLLSQSDLSSNTESLDWPSLWPFLGLFWDVRLKELENQGWPEPTPTTRQENTWKYSRKRPSSRGFPFPWQICISLWHAKNVNVARPWSIPIQHFNGKPPKPSRPFHLSSPPHNMLQAPQKMEKTNFLQLLPACVIACWVLASVFCTQKRLENLIEAAKNLCPRIQVPGMRCSSSIRKKRSQRSLKRWKKMKKMNEWMNEWNRTWDNWKNASWDCQERFVNFTWNELSSRTKLANATSAWAFGATKLGLSERNLERFLERSIEWCKHSWNNYDSRTVYTL